MTKLTILSLIFLILPAITLAQEIELEETNQPSIIAEAGPGRETIVGREIVFDTSQSTLPDQASLPDIFWDLGDGTKTTGPKVTHAYKQPGVYSVRLRLSTPDGIFEDTTEIRVFNHLMILTTDSTTPESTLEQYKQQAAKENILLLIIKSNTSSPDTAVAEDLTQKLSNLRQDIPKANLIITTNSGSASTSALSQFAQQLQTNTPSSDRISLSTTGIVILSDTPLSLVAPTAQTVFDQLQPQYVLLSRPAALSTLLQQPDPEIAKNAVLNSNLESRLLGKFSARTVRDINLTNFVSFGISSLINQGVPINSLVLILMLPLIASILAFARQVIGIKAFGLITPVMTTLSFLVMGLPYGLIAFLVVVLSGTLTRFLLRRFHLLYLPRMALVLTMASIAILLLLGLGAALNPASLSAFSIFPALMLIILAEEFIAVQFTSGAKTASTTTAWTLVLSIIGYYIMSWELLRTFLISYPELVLLTIPFNLALGRWSGLRLTEYIRFRQLLRHGRST